MPKIRSSAFPFFFSSGSRVRADNAVPFFFSFLPLFQCKKNQFPFLSTPLFTDRRMRGALSSPPKAPSLRAESFAVWNKNGTSPLTLLFARMIGQVMLASPLFFFLSDHGLKEKRSSSLLPGHQGCSFLFSSFPFPKEEANFSFSSTTLPGG